MLAEVQEATDAGRWAFGYVAYEAAAGLDPHLAVHPSAPGGLPLVWFGLCDEPDSGGARWTPVPATGPHRARWTPDWTPEEPRPGRRRRPRRASPPVTPTSAT